MTDDEIKNMAGHPDAVPEIYREGFLKGYRQGEKAPKPNEFAPIWQWNPLRLNDPPEPTAYCPNCGKLCWLSDLNHTNSNMISKLWGVCSDCAKL